MGKDYKIESVIIGVLLFLGLAALGFFIAKSAYLVKTADRVVTVFKGGLMEKLHWVVQWVDGEPVLPPVVEIGETFEPPPTP